MGKGKKLLRFTTDATVEEGDAEGGGGVNDVKLLHCKRPHIAQQTLGKALSHHCPWHRKMTTTMLQLRPQQMRNESTKLVIPKALYKCMQIFTNTLKVALGNN
uniref:Uncharacterized protein n=1 Tax=Globodera rostochiensis TaxID=31243 RepID=A0A914GQP6_GLORO